MPRLLLSANPQRELRQGARRQRHGPHGSRAAPRPRRRAPAPPMPASSARRLAPTSVPVIHAVLVPARSRRRCCPGPTPRAAFQTSTLSSRVSWCKGRGGDLTVVSRMWAVMVAARRRSAPGGAGRLSATMPRSTTGRARNLPAHQLKPAAAWVARRARAPPDLAGKTWLFLRVSDSRRGSTAVGSQRNQSGAHMVRREDFGVTTPPRRVIEGQPGGAVFDPLATR